MHCRIVVSFSLYFVPNLYLFALRADAMHTIESTIVELGGIFSQLATMVKEQVGINNNNNI